MPLTLRDSLEPLTLRDSARYSQNQGDFADYLEASDTNPISRGWTSVSEGLAGSDLLAQANAAERAGDINLSQALEQQAMDRMRRAQTWAPTTQSVRGIDGLGSAMEWVGGHVGGGARSMLAPLAGGVGGRALGGIAGGLIAGPAGAAIGANLGGAAGAFVPSYDMQYNESVGQSMMDPEIRASRSAQDIHRTGQAAGAAGGVLEAIVPAGIGKTAVGGLGKRTIGGVLAREAGEEALTEGAQSLVGQTGQNQLAGRNLTDYDYMEALDAAAAGAVGGAGVSVGGAMVGAARDKLMAGKEKVVETARDPLGAIIQKGYELADKAGRKQARDEIAAGNTPQPLRTMYEEAAAQNADERIFQPPTKDETNEMITSRMREDANRWADKILSAQPRALSPRENELREAAAQFKSDGDWSKLRTVLRKNKLIEERESMMASFDAPGAKASEMTPEGKELDALSNAWLKNEGKRYGEYFADGSDEAKGLGAKLFAWIKNDFGKSMTEDGEIFIPRAFVDALGERAPGVIESAITAARKEGWAIKDGGDAVSAVKEYVSSNEGDVGALKSAIRYTQEKNWTDKMLQRFAKELRQKNGQLDKDDYKWLKTQVVDPTALLKHFQKPSRFYKAEKNQLLRSGSPKTQADMDVDGESLELSVDRDGEVVSESSTASAGITDNDGDWGSSVSEFDGDSKPTFIGNTLEGYPFDTTDERQVAKKNAKLGEYANDPAAFAREVGVWQQAKRAAKGNQALLTEYEDALIREHGNSLSDARFEGELNPVDLDDGERKSILSQINKRFRMVEVETTKSANDMAFDKKDVHLEKADPRDQNLGPSKGILRFMRYNKDGSEISRPFVTSTQMLISKMFKSQDSMTGSTKYYEGTAQEMLQLLSDGVASLLRDKSFGGEGRPAKIAFTVKADGTPRWVDVKDIKSWPKNLLLFRDKEGGHYTLGEALAQIEEQAKKTPKEMRNELRTINWRLLRKVYEEVDGEDKKVARDKVNKERAAVEKVIEGDNDAAVKRAYDRYSDFIPSVPSFTLDFDPDTLNPHNKLAIKEKKPWEKAEDLKRLLDLTTDKELRRRIVRARGLASKRDFADSNALWKELVDSGKLQAAGIVTDVEVGRGNQVKEGQVGPDDLSAYDPDYIKRTDDGRMRSKSIEYEAQSVIGTSKKVSSEGSSVNVRGKVVNVSSGVKSIANDNAMLDEKRKYIKRNAEGDITPVYPVNFSAEKLQAAKDWVVSTMRGGVEPLITAIGKMDLAQLRITDAALFGRETVTERKSRVSAPNVSVEKVDAAEVAALAKRTGVSEKVAEGMLRRGDKMTHTRVYDKDIGGVRTKEAGEAQTVTKQIGLLDLHQTKLAKQYFNGSLRDALAFLKTGQENVAALRGAIDDRKDDIRRSEAAVERARDRATDQVRQADSGGKETGVVAQPGRERTAENRELGAGQQGRNAEDGVTAKQDAWVMKFASMSMKDMRAYINALPAGKLERAFTVLNSFHPADNSNPFWQRNNLDNYTDAKSDVVFEAQELIRDRLDAEDGETKYSMMSTEIHNSLGKTGFAATHDSPIRHEGKFDWRKHKGKGEGNASFGAGTYLSTADGVHKSYKKQFTAQVSTEGSFTWNGDLYESDYETAGVVYKNGYAEMSPAEEAVAYAILVEGRPAEEAISAAIDDAFFNVDRTASDVADLISVSDVNVSAKDLSYVLKAFRERAPMDGASVAQSLTKFFDVGRWNRMVASAGKKVSDLRKMDSSGIVVNQKNISPTYHVTVNIKSEQLLDWDAPLSEQSEFVKKALRGVKEARPAVVTDIATGKVVESVAVSGETIYNNLARRLGSQAAASDYLQSLGILGHKYAAAGGRNEKHPNYVIYDDSRIETNYVHFSKQNTGDSTNEFKQIDPEQALADIARMLGKDFDAKVAKKLGGKAGMWKPGIIKLATSAAEGTQFHEALHELFNQMRTHGAANVAQIIERVANSPLILRKLEQLLSDHPKAIKQLKSPEEAAAYLFQFWNMGLINVGPETKSLFQTIKDLIVEAAKELHSWVNAAKRDERKAEKAQKMDEAEVRRLFEALAGGAAATSDVNVRQALYDGLRKNIEAHTKAVEDLGQRVEGFWQGIGRYVVTSESMLNLYSKHPELKTVADKFHQMAGKSMKNQARDPSLMARGGLIEAKHAEVQRRLNPFERFLMDGKYDEKDMALAAKHLEANTKSADKKINALIDYVHKYYGEMYDYMVQSDVRRLDPNSEERWVPIQKRKDYSTQSWSIEELTKDHDGFVSTLLDKHAKELAYMAQQANAEIAAWNKDPKAELTSPTAQAQLDKQIAERLSPEKPIAKLGPLQEVTPEMIAEQIYVRLLNSTGMVDIQETNWSLGLTPAAGAVNRRELDWLDKEAFSKYKSKDLVEIVTNYTRTMVARAEYQKRFGYGGEVIGEAMDTAFLREMGGQALVDSANASLDGEIKRWKKDARAWYKDNPGVPYAEPYPTLRLVGIQQHRAQVGAEASNEALIKAEKTLRPAINAVRAMEGTLGNDISPAMRSVNSWINTYTNVTLLPFALFTNFSDVIGITVNGGTLGDAWNAFTAGMREVRNTWVNEKGADQDTMRAEEWGVSDAGAMLDTLGHNYSSVYMTQKARNINNKFFRIIGMEGWNRGVRITATAVGERIISNWVKNGVDAKKPGEKARFERLFGEGADPKKIKLDAQGNLDTQDAANRAAIQRFVQDAVMSSNPAVRAIWMSDTRMATFAHLKNYAYAFHSVMLKGILDQTMHGNLRPALVAGLGYASISIAAGAVKEMLIPGDEPYWMKGGLDGYLEYGYNMANLGGVPQMYLESVTDFDPAKLAGPFWDRIQNLLSSPIPGLTVNANLSPFEGDTEIEILRDRKIAVEIAKILPPSNLMGRAMDSLVGD